MISVNLFMRGAPIKVPTAVGEGRNMYLCDTDQLIELWDGTPAIDVTLPGEEPALRLPQTVARTIGFAIYDKMDAVGRARFIQGLRNPDLRE